MTKAKRNMTEKFVYVVFEYSARVTPGIPSTDLLGNEFSYKKNSTASIRSFTRVVVKRS